MGYKVIIMTIEVHMLISEYNKIVNIVKDTKESMRELSKEKDLHYELSDVRRKLTELYTMLLGKK